MNPRTSSTLQRHRVSAIALVFTAACAAVISATSPAQAAAPSSYGQVPWNHLSRGWTMALWAAKGDATATVYLIGPRGHRYPITAVSRSAYPVVSSPDGRTVLLEARRGLLRLDLRSGHRSRIKLPAGWVLGFTRDGRSLIESVDVPRGEFVVSRLERFGLDGDHEVNYPMRTSGAGRLGTLGVVALPGARLATGARHGVVVLRHNGTVAERLARDLDNCAVSSLWRPGVALARCGRGVLWAVPITGGRVTRLTDGRSKENPWGYTTTWRYSEGRLGLALNSCGPETLVSFNRNGHGERITVPSPTGDPGLAASPNGMCCSPTTRPHTPAVRCSAGPLTAAESRTRWRWAADRVG